MTDLDIYVDLLTRAGVRHTVREDLKFNVIEVSQYVRGPRRQGPHRGLHRVRGGVRVRPRERSSAEGRYLGIGGRMTTAELATELRMQLETERNANDGKYSVVLRPATINQLIEALTTLTAENESLTRERDRANMLHDATCHTRPRVEQAETMLKQVALCARTCEAENERLREVIKAFLAQYALVEPHLVNQFKMTFVRTGQQYTGPSIGTHIEALREALGSTRA